MRSPKTVRGTAIEPSPYTEIDLGDGLSTEQGPFCAISYHCHQQQPTSSSSTVPYPRTNNTHKTRTYPISPLARVPAPRALPRPGHAPRGAGGRAPRPVVQGVEGDYYVCVDVFHRGWRWRWGQWSSSPFDRGSMHRLTLNSKTTIGRRLPLARAVRAQKAAAQIGQARARPPEPPFSRADALGRAARGADSAAATVFFFL